MVVVLEYVMCREKLGDQNQTCPRSSQRQAERQQAQAETLHSTIRKSFFSIWVVKHWNLAAVDSIHTH